jgi:hypothetical protein
MSINYEKLSKNEKLFWDCYRELFANAEPPGNFDKLVENAIINDRGQHEIQFMKYEISQEKMDEIISKYQAKLRTSWLKRGFRNAVLLGCSPKTKA